jgi:ABC-type transport system substrate-binding protein
VLSLYDPGIDPRTWRRRWLWLVVVAILAAACSGGGDGGEPPAAAPAQPGELRIGVGEDIWPLTGQGGNSRHFAAGELNIGVYEALVSMAPDFTVRPGLAERWELVAPTTWRFHLRPNVTWHDGRRFGADDVVWSWTGRDALLRSVSGTLDTVTKVDDLTVDFVSTRPNLRLPEQLVHPEGPIVPKDAHNDATPPVGTGPFKVVDYQARKHVVVERYDGYWGTKAGADRLTFRFMPDPDVRLDALRNGDVDVVTGLPREAVASVLADSRLGIIRAAPGATQVLSFSTEGQFAAERAVRQAVSLAVDRSRYVDQVLGGNGQAGRWMSPPAVLGPAAELVAPSPFDPARARQVLDEAGWAMGADGARVNGRRRLTMTLIGGPAVPETGLQWLSAKLRDVGIETTVRKAFDIRTGEQNRERGYDVELAVVNQNDANPAFLVATRTAPDPDYTALAAQSLAAGSKDEVQQAAAAMTAVLVNREYSIVPVAGVFHLYGVRAGVALAAPHPSAIHQTWVTLSSS